MIGDYFSRVLISGYSSCYFLQKSDLIFHRRISEIKFIIDSLVNKNLNISIIYEENARTARDAQFRSVFLKKMHEMRFFDELWVLQ